MSIYPESGNANTNGIFFTIYPIEFQIIIFQSLITKKEYAIFNPIFMIKTQTRIINFK